VPLTGRTGRRLFFATLGQVACAETLARNGTRAVQSAERLVLRAIADAAGPCLGQPARSHFRRSRRLRPTRRFANARQPRVAACLHFSGIHGGCGRDSRHDDEHRFVGPLKPTRYREIANSVRALTPRCATQIRDQLDVRAEYEKLAIARALSESLSNPLR